MFIKISRCEILEIKHDAKQICGFLLTDRYKCIWYIYLSRWEETVFDFNEVKTFICVALYTYKLHTDFKKIKGGQEN